MTATLEELIFDSLRRAYCMTATQFDFNLTRCRILPRKARRGFCDCDPGRGLFFDPVRDAKSDGRAYCMIASQFDLNRTRCRALLCKARGGLAIATLEGLIFNPFREAKSVGRAYCMTASQFNVNLTKSHILQRKARGVFRGRDPGGA